MQKIKYLDGIRGFAALFVVLSHFVVAFYPALYTSEINQIHTASGVELIIAKSPLNLFYNGNFAVCIFFVLSGYVLTYKYFSTKNSQYLISSAVKRYIRLSFPVLITVLLIFILMKVSLFYNREAGELSFSNWWLGTFWNFTTTFPHAIKNALFDVFFNYNDQYNTVLWTMTYELFGSFLVFGFAALFGKVKNRYIFYFIVIILFFKTYYLAFILGMILSDLMNSKYSQTGTYKHWVFKFILLGVGLYLGSYPTGANVQNSIYSTIKTADINTTLTYHIIGAFITMLVLLNSGGMQAFFSLKIFDVLGKISFSLYLIHVVIIGSLTSYIFIQLNKHLTYSLSVLVSITISIPIITTASYLMYRYVDKNGIKLANVLYDRFFKP